MPQLLIIMSLSLNIIKTVLVGTGVFLRAKPPILSQRYQYTNNYLFTWKYSQLWNLGNNYAVFSVLSLLTWA